MDTLNRFFRWWFSELWELVPTRFKNLFARPTTLIRFELENDHWNIVKLDKTGKQVVGMMARTGVDDELNAMLGSNVDAIHGYDIALPEKYVLCRHLNLPKATLENLHEVLAFQMDKETPFKVEDVFYSWHIEGENPARTHIHVTMYVVKKQIIDEIVSALAPIAITPNDQSCKIEDDNLIVPLVLPKERWQLMKMASVTLVIINFMIVVGLITMPLYTKQQKLEMLQGELAMIKKEAALVMDIQAKIDDEKSKNEKLAAIVAKDYTKVELLEIVTELVPDNTWLRRMDIKDDTISLQGRSESASNLITALEKSGLFNSLRFVSPVTRDANNNMERFNISAKIQKTDSKKKDKTMKDDDLMANAV